MYNLAIIARRVLPERAVRHPGPGHRRGRRRACCTCSSRCRRCLRLGMRWRPIVDLRHSGVREVARLFAPRVLGLGVVQINKVLSGVLFASFLVAGSIGLSGLRLADDHDAAGAGDGHRHGRVSDAVGGQRARTPRPAPAGVSALAAHDPVPDRSGQHRPDGARRAGHPALLPARDRSTTTRRAARPTPWSSSRSAWPATPRSKSSIASSTPCTTRARRCSSPSARSASTSCSA